MKTREQEAPGRVEHGIHVFDWIFAPKREQARLQEHALLPGLVRSRILFSFSQHFRCCSLKLDNGNLNEIKRTMSELVFQLSTHFRVVCHFPLLTFLFWVRRRPS